MDYPPFQTLRKLDIKLHMEYILVDISNNNSVKYLEYIHYLYRYESLINVTPIYK